MTDNIYALKRVAARMHVLPAHLPALGALRLSDWQFDRPSSDAQLAPA